MTLELSASWRPRVFMSLIGAIPVGIGIVALVRGRPALLPVGLSLGLVAMWNVWLAAFKIEVDHAVLMYRSLLGGRQRIALQDISKAVFESGYQSAGVLEPPSRLVVLPRSSTQQPIRINRGVFDDRDVIRLIERLRGRGVDVIEEGG